MGSPSERSRWKIHGERLVDDTPHIKLSIASVELPNGAEFEQYVSRVMSGKWLGFGKNFKVNSGEWELTWVDKATSRRTIRKYHLKA